MKVSVKLYKQSKRTLSDGTQVHYLGIRTTINGDRSQESLGGKYLYVKPKDSKQRKHNKDANAYAQEIIRDRQFKLERSAYGLEDLNQLDRPFIDVYNDYRDLNGRDWKDAENNKWDICAKHLNAFYPNLIVRQLTPTLSKSFLNYLYDLKKSNGESLSRNSANAYMKPYVQVAKDLWQQGILSKDPMNKVKMKTAPKEQAPSLTEEELKIAFNTEPEEGHKMIVNAFLFSCLTGLRLSDLIELRWSNVHKHSNGTPYLNIVMKKTEEPIKIWLSEQALELMGEPQQVSQRVFPQVNKNTYQYDILQKFIMYYCGINKKITWHSGRHTFAYRYLRHHKNPVTLMHLLGHKNIETTQEYFNYKPEDSLEELINMPKL